MVRRLPVLQSSSGEDAEAEGRPAFHWVVIGAAFVLALFLPLSVIAVGVSGALIRRLALAEAEARAVSAAMVMVVFGLSAWGAGAVVGRFGVRATPRTPSAAGALGAAAVIGLAVLAGGLRFWPVLAAAAAVLLLTGALLAWFGAGFGRRRRLKQKELP